MPTLPSDPETHLKLIQCSCTKASLYAKHHGVSANLIIYIVLICVTVEQKKIHVNILPVINMLTTFEQLFSCGFRHFLGRINKNALLSDFDPGRIKDWAILPSSVRKINQIVTVFFPVLSK